MSDGSGAINLNSLSSTSNDNVARFQLDGGDKFTYSYNPCVSFSTEQFDDLAILQERINSTLQYNLGVQSKETFQYTPARGIYIQYKSDNDKRTSFVGLICEESGTNEDHNLEYLGELITLEYEFILTSPCACPGVCDDNGVIPPVPKQFDWSALGADMVGLLLHDMILIFTVILVLILLKIFLDFSCMECLTQRVPGVENKNYDYDTNA